MVVIGGEDNTNGNTWTNIGFMYNPVTNAWSAQLTQPFGTNLQPSGTVGSIGDSQSVILQNGTMLIANVFSNAIASFNPATATFTALNPTDKVAGASNDEEGWTILPNGKILSVNASVANSFEIYDPVTNTWGGAGSTAGVNLADTNSACQSTELGPAVSRPDGTIVHFTGNTAGKNAVYNIATGTWSHPAGVDFPVISGAQYGSSDAPASLLPNGNVLVQGSPNACTSGTVFHTPSHYFEWNGLTLTQVADPPNGTSLKAYQGRMLLLPTGEVLVTGYNQSATDVVQLYSNGGVPQNPWRPVITTFPPILGLGLSMPISGQQFNGFSLGATYGDDSQSSTNYPLVRVVNNASGHVFYLRTHDHSRMGVEAVGDTSIQSTTFDVPAGIEPGPSQLFVVTNGIPSLPAAVNVGFLAPVISKVFTPGSVPLGTNATLTFTITNPNAAAVPLTGIGFTDVLPAGLSTGGVIGSCGAGNFAVTSSSITLTGATLAGNTSCTFSFIITGNTPGVKLNTSGNVTSLEGGPGNTASSTLLVVAPPVITKTFAPNKVLPGGTTKVTFNITNPNNFVVLTGVAFTDTLPANLVVATPNALTSTCGGVAAATGGTISLTGGTIAISGTCTVTANVTGVSEGIYLNSVQVTSANGGIGNTATDTLFVALTPTLSKSFGEVSIGVGNTTALTFTLANPNHIVTLHGLLFTDTLPTGLVVATPSGVNGTCPAGTITAVAGSNLIMLSGAALAPQANCIFSVKVTANGAALSTLTNTTSTVTSTEALPGAAASANIFVGDPFQISYAANLAVGDSFTNITNGGALGAALPSGTTATTIGAICANVYAFTPDEQLVSCCSCPVTPNGLISLSAQNDLVSNTLTPAVPTALVVKLLASVPVGGSCTNSAASVTAASLANGMKSYGATIHATPAAGTYGVTETPFSSGTLSAGELSRVTTLCNFILANGSGFGVCRACRLGGLGAERQ